MPVGGMDLNLLVTLRALLEEGNVTHAGAQVGISQPSTSVALARLRRHYKDELLVRSGRGYCLTPLARSLLPSVQESLRLVESAFDVSGGFVPATSDRVFSITLSDYAIMVLVEPLLRRVHDLAPGVGFELSPIPPDMHETDRGLRQHDLLIAPMGYRFLGQSEVIFRDRFVCIADPGNPKLHAGWLSLADLGKLPHAAATFGHSNLNPAERALDELGVERHVQVTTVGWLPLPFVVAGTDLVAVVPERLARRVALTAGVAVAEPPFGRVELVEAAWWHPMRTPDPGLQWLHAILRQVAEPLALPEETRARAPRSPVAASPASQA
jgi:DNA-binding transcriptional LysR family regulator